MERTMEYKYPKKITIGSIVFKIYYSKKEGSSHVGYKSDKKHKGPHIFFGLGSPDSFLDLVIHELKEIIQIEQDTRMNKRNEGACLFHYNHTQHEQLCSTLAGLLTKFIK